MKTSDHERSTKLCEGNPVGIINLQ